MVIRSSQIDWLLWEYFTESDFIVWVSWTILNKRSRELDDIKKAIKYGSRALALTPEDHPDLPRELDDLKKAIKYESIALVLTPGDHPDLPSRLNNLGTSYRNQFNRLGEQDDLEQVIKYESRPLVLTPDGRPDVASQQANLITSYEDSLQRLGELEDHDKTLDAYYPQVMSNNDRQEAPLVDETQSRRKVTARMIPGAKYSPLPSSHELLQNEPITPSTGTQFSAGLPNGPTNSDPINKIRGVDHYEESVLRDTPISKQMCLQICVGLSYMHGIGIIHGDLKGANIFISDNGTPVLADFGNSLHKDQTMKFTETTSCRSLTIRWSAAELLDGSGVHSEASDVYALAMTIYQEVLAGDLPYKGKTIFVIMNLVAKETPPERPKSITSEKEDGNKLWDFLLRCWSLEPKARPGASQVADMMKAIDPSGLSLHVLAKTTDP
ncbi:unnamed protein product [Rhizoctonia solani]|uniref:Protein kinase domain-containing protein n=1 Tax=Rhizoctonia solani TaxID=456999 RepID=A0A8H3E9Q7_9AGAM|nr:unnamed protein product [Rhizoctonia solani]